MLVIKDLKAKRDDKLILKGIDLSIPDNEIHVIMGPNGSGKSTLASSLMGSPDIEVVSGSVLFDSTHILEIEPNLRSNLGLFLAFQYPVEVPGVPLISFLKLAYEKRHEVKITPGRFLQIVNKKAKRLNVRKDLLKRYLNQGFSGGEKKKIEILQMALLAPKFAVLDETDSGLDITALKEVAKGVLKIKEETKMGDLVITHYKRILDYLNPDRVHILVDGKIIKSGGIELAEELEEKGYNFL